jgi:peptidoglycan/LPS O-acetylase OafA/YrhL
MYVKKIYGFDYIKIIAASLIVLHHYQQVFVCQFSGFNFYGGRIGFGYLVELFFTISGFLTIYSDKKKICAEKFGGGHLLHKLIRVCPMAIISIFVCLILKTIQSVQLHDNQLALLWNVKALVANFMLLFAGYPYFEMIGINNPIWYICVLIQCYVVYYILDWFVQKFNLKRCVIYIFILLSCMVLYYFKLLNEASFRGITSFAIGILLFIMGNFTTEYIHNKRQLIGRICMLLIVAFCPLIFLGIKQRWILQFLLYPLLVFGCYHLDLKGNTLISKASDISFDVYIWHYPLMVCMQIICLRIEVIHSYNIMFMFLLLSWCYAFVLWKYIDLPLRRLGRRLYKIYGK